jgi:hypothetical protein
VIDIKPALTPEQWGQWNRYGWLDVEDPTGRNHWPFSWSVWRTDEGFLEFEEEHHRIPDELRYPLAALCLHERPEGFTHEDVRRHRASAEELTRQLDAQGPEPEWDFPQEEIDSKTRHRDWHLTMATRIAALLPQEPKP